jgi:hypothetical protein
MIKQLTVLSYKVIVFNLKISINIFYDYSGIKLNK